VTKNALLTNLLKKEGTKGGTGKKVEKQSEGPNVSGIQGVKKKTNVKKESEIQVL